MMVSVSTLSTNQISSHTPPLRGGDGGRPDGLTPSPRNAAGDPYRSDRISLSPQAYEQTRNARNRSNDLLPRKTGSPDAAPQAVASQEGMSAEELKHIQDLQRRDAQVRAHERAHLAAAGHYAAGGASFTFQMGPNGKRYAVGGEVPIDVSKESTPEQTLQKMEVVSRAALAPLNPSPADRRIASQAAVIAAQARREIQAESLATSGQDDQIGESISLFSETDEEAGNETAINSPEEPLMPTLPAENGNRRQMILKAYQRQTAI